MIQFDPKYADAYYSRAGIRSILGELEATRGNTEKVQSLYETAIEDWTQAITINPEYLQAYDLRAKTKIRLGQFEHSQGNVEKAQELRLRETAIEDWTQTIKLCTKVC